MENFVFHNPTKIIFGKDTNGQIGKIINEYNIKKILVVFGGGSVKKNGVYDNVIKSLKSFSIEPVELWDVRPNPVISHVKEAIKIAREKNVEAILAVGGGSVIDESKAIASGFFLDDIWSAFENKIPLNKALPLFTILTLSATGTEMNQFAVVTNEELKKKWNIFGEALYPVVSIIDPSVQTSLPWKQTVNGAIDALSHIMESYFLGDNEEVTLSINEALMRTILKVTDNLQKNISDYESRSALCWAATLALNGITAVSMKGGDWSSHTIEHSISSLHPEVAHGTGLAVVFPAWIKYVSSTGKPIFQRWAENIWETGDIGDAICKLKEKYAKWGSPISLREIGIKECEIAALVENAQLTPQIGNLKKLYKSDIEEILKIAF